MKFAPEKKLELNVQMPLAKVREELSKAAAEKKQKNSADPAYRPFYGKITESGFKLTQYSAFRSSYKPIVTGDLTEVTESKPAQNEGENLTKAFTRVEADMKLRPWMKIFSWFWLVLCAVILGLAFWLCFKRGFEHHWWTLLIGPVLFIIERIVCGIGFASSARKVENTIKKLLKQ
ncbi:MAG: hypothetical protein J6P98_02825 [Clostridia bacterium]|nr:hypothetical protein [Clostridia bacterium]